MRKLTSIILLLQQVDVEISEHYLTKSHKYQTRPCISQDETDLM